jgi:hypothetical protein
MWNLARRPLSAWIAVLHSPYRVSPAPPIDSIADAWLRSGDRRGRVRRYARLVAALVAPVLVLLLTTVAFGLRGAGQTFEPTRFYRVDPAPMFDGFNGVVQCQCVDQEAAPWLVQSCCYEFQPALQPRDVCFSSQWLRYDDYDSPPECVASCTPLDPSLRAWLKANRSGAGCAMP